MLASLSLGSRTLSHPRDIGSLPLMTGLRRPQAPGCAPASTSPARATEPERSASPTDDPPSLCDRIPVGVVVHIGDERRIAAVRRPICSFDDAPCARVGALGFIEISSRSGVPRPPEPCAPVSLIEESHAHCPK